MLRVLLLLMLCASLAACAQLGRDRRDAPWDPKPGQSLMDQIPNWEGGANQVCCGHLRTCKAHQTPRC